MTAKCERLENGVELSGVLARSLHTICVTLDPLSSVPRTLPSARDSFWLIIALYKSQQRPPHLVDNNTNTISSLKPSPNHQQETNNSTSRIHQTNPIMKLSLAAFAVAMFAEAALAANCKGGLYYCGRTLLKKGIVPHSVDFPRGIS